ncbi:chemotaxis protein CheA [Marinovum sp. 2_MG-2023]|uniref:chemotaxis protein CheA n=1 Tax=unclassified Marinovum TaxID=2647166 RepID=UPI0026E1CE50|nr:MULTISPECIES: chemotaxis protein CheA [unclassified Marinovum]MDO6731614.1 chemotaxis protein CheA [Marinovum sp. 2_MG-2023]MDO6778260.1 chemotaxis protein CheA [Marinovum sp. 1_MG-2023]
MSELRDLFFQECDDLLESLSSGLNDLDDASGDAETINAMFRAVHSIKGGAGAFGLDALVAFSHAFENVMDDLRAERLQVTADTLALMFTAGDHLSDLVDAARNGTEMPVDTADSILSDLELLSQSVGGSPMDVNTPEPDFVPLAMDFGGPLDLGDLPDIGDPADPVQPDPLGNAALPDLPDLAAPAAGVAAGLPGINMSFAPTSELYANGHDPALLFRALEDLGDLTVRADIAGLEPLGVGDWRVPTLVWHLDITPDDGVDLAAIHEVFEFVEGLCTLVITEHTTPDAPQQTASAPLLEFAPLAPLSSSSSRSEPPLPTDGALFTDRMSSDDPPPNDPSPLPDALPGNPPHSKDSARASTIRVDLQRVDRLINLVGELVISESMLRQSMKELPHSASKTVEEAMGQLKQLSGVIQESVMAIRAQPVRSLFQRMSRTVRETAREAGKSARLVTVGDATEVDKTVTERLVEPLTHMVRNAVDHGLETTDIRRALGKDDRGTITLEAAHRSGRVVITLRDDGAGINRQKVREIAEAKGLVRPEDDLSDSDIDNILFRPGFSTATKVSNLSGRGVGMDVVRSEIQSLGGRVTLHSEPGQGTAISISLPLTLAVLEGMVVTVAGESLVVPTLALREMLQPGQGRIERFCDDDRVLTMGTELVPIVDLGLALGYRRAPVDLNTLSLLLVEGDSGRRTALAVDELIDQREVVIKGLEQNYQQIPGIAAATILGDGQIALIVDTDQMIASAGGGLSTTAMEPDQTEVIHHA